ncbi:hypothetical protein PoB_003531600 [Plakobranchus ocellatus]|uniref:Uncharacterized protein n=1 Tax=Plakobranchus ocellatus TaxID=259542 RepID=A0AAV4AKI5_9GAST|nr:hypothetical protein PoB_003531600 [Plakobranchus ocellatus]
MSEFTFQKLEVVPKIEINEKWNQTFQFQPPILTAMFASSALAKLNVQVCRVGREQDKTIMIDFSILTQGLKTLD